MTVEPRKARTKPLTPTQEAEALLGALGAVLGAFPGSTVVERLPFGEMSQRCAGHLQTQLGRQPCGNFVVDPRRGSLCENPRGCRREGRVNGYSGECS